ncbi:hypothetical protein [Caulobacter sp. NIBR1757]|uniref:hypothetical protein n=1 Tax=Caulobacter sp. NIBR1757 TaxID=3016000 RepID=UPI0022F12DE6|nr:hypothetical protein [Caulobacter sp. NIBR1757]WGM40540.1 hypothetical protein AMEJIAPC_03485 [Caulobacter sp. NIBR1757]
MKCLKALALVSGLIAGLAPAAGALAWGNDVRTYGYQAILQDPEFIARAPKGVKLYFADQPVQVKQQLGETHSNRKRPTPARKTPISVACQTVARDALVAMAREAQSKGGNAVIGIRSLVDGQAGDSPDQYRCSVGMQMLGVSLTGTIATVE